MQPPVETAQLNHGLICTSAERRTAPSRAPCHSMYAALQPAPARNVDLRRPPEAGQWRRRKKNATAGSKTRGSRRRCSIADRPTNHSAPPQLILLYLPGLSLGSGRPLHGESTPAPASHHHRLIATVQHS
jgi:hypothetical protein